jgi:MHS family proline/betaine transporter-like MFS transporter
MLREKTQTKLTKEQLQTVSLLSVGVFLEDFDVMLFLHTAIWINDLFFPKTDPVTQQLITAFSFCSSYLLTPLGALCFGYLGDVFGRKSVIVLSSMLMACCCITTAFLPTYAQIGIAAPIILTLCRMIQNMSGTSEINGVEIYLTESLKPPIQYPIVALVPVCSRVGNILALGLAAIFSGGGMLPKQFEKDGWRFAFLIGALVGVIGAIARSSLKEAAEFSDRQKLLKEQFQKADIKWSKDNQSINPKVPLSTCIALFFVHCGRPICFYFIFFHCAEILRNTFNFTPEQIIKNNLIPLTVNLISALVFSMLSYKLAPLKLIKCKLMAFLILLACFPFVTSTWNDAKTILIFQCLMVFFRFDHIPAAPIFIKHFPVLKRFRYSSVLLASAYLSTYIITSFGLVLITKIFNNNGVLLLFVPFGICFNWAIGYFANKEETEKKQSIERQKSTFAGHL